MNDHERHTRLSQHYQTLTMSYSVSWGHEVDVYEDRRHVRTSGRTLGKTVSNHGSPLNCMMKSGSGVGGGGGGVGVGSLGGVGLRDGREGEVSA